MLYTDSQSVIQLCKNLVFRERSKHIQVKYHFIRDITAQRAFRIEKVPTDLNPFDMGTKILPVSKFNVYKNFLNNGIG